MLERVPDDAAAPRLVVEVWSDGTGWTAEGVARSLVSQFPGFAPEVRVHGGLRTADAVRQHIACLPQLAPPAHGVVVATFTLAACRDALRAAPWPVIDVLGPALERLGAELGAPPAGVPGRAHGAGETATERALYGRRIAAIEFALAHDDGQRPEGWSRADVLLLGVSRSGKTPTSLALALHQGWFVANLPLVEEDFADPLAPIWTRVAECAGRAVGLIIAPERLAEIRQTRRPGSRYAALAQCEAEVRAARAAFARLRVPVVDVTQASIEEIAQRVRELHEARRP